MNLTTAKCLMRLRHRAAALGAWWPCWLLVLACLGLPVAAQTGTTGNERWSASGSSMRNGNAEPTDPDAASLDDTDAAANQRSRAVGADRPATSTQDRNGQTRAARQSGTGTGAAQLKPAAPVRLSEFERHVRKLQGAADVRRFGADLATSLGLVDDPDNQTAAVPADYLLRIGDELVVTIWGSVDASLILQIDRSGRITIPRVGPVMLSGVRYADASDAISKRVAQVYRNFQVSVSLGQLRGVRVYVTGFVQQPGPLVVSSLSTLAQALLRAGGPSAAGSFRDIQLRRGSAVVARLDLYDLLLGGNRAADVLVQPADVIHVGPVGPQVAIIGSVNRPAIFEVRREETIADVLRMAGGYSAVADTSRLAIERLDDRATVRVTQVDQPGAGQLPLANGDVLRAFNAVEAVQSMQKQNARVLVEGEVARPGEYVLPPGSSIADAVRAAGGATPGAYLYATEFTRESVRETQQRNYERALRDFETQLARNNSTQRTASTEEAAAVSAASAASTRLVEQLRALKPTGRVVMQLSPGAGTLPELVVENGARLYIPPRPTTVGVFGSVFSAGSYLHNSARTVGDYLNLAGGPTRGADSASVFVVRANGSVVSSLQASGYFSRGNQLDKEVALPGDTIFVPEELNKITWVQGAKDWTQIFYQFGIGLAGIKSALN